MADQDQRVYDTIERLVDEEHRLYEREALGEDEHSRLRDVQVELDRCWDLLRQRRARRAAGEDPDEATARPEGTVEGYLQ